MEGVMNINLLNISQLQVEFHTLQGICHAVDKVNLSIHQGETLGLVGESGCGKTVTALSILRLIPSPPGKIVGGNIFFESTDLLKLDTHEIRKIRGNSISMIFQEPMASLNPLFTIGDQISEVFMLHRGKNKKEAWAHSIDMLNRVKIPDPHKRINEYPHQLSGGMRQRVMIAMALACNPKLLIADEPTTALDVTTQAQILELLLKLKEEFNTSVMLITHNLGIVAEVTNKIFVMYAGRIVEGGSVEDIFDHPMHPYTQGLLRSMPYNKKREESLPEIPGGVPNLYHLSKGCRFYPRCDRRVTQCQEEPSTREISLRHFVSCWLAETHSA
jgi:peptide/nickel transport system ATP-binding protein/oligopeptide transport system ATP-binding protein